MTTHSPKPAGLENLHAFLSPSSAHPILDAEVQSFVDAQADSSNEMFYLLEPTAMRDAFVKLQEKHSHRFLVSTVDLTVPTGPGRSIAVSIRRPLNSARVLPIVMFFHGGGWMAGDRSTHDRLMSEIAVKADTAVVFVDYTRAPEAVFPSQNEESYAALVFIVTNAVSLGLDPSRLALVGDGAGAQHGRGRRHDDQASPRPGGRDPSHVLSGDEHEYRQWFVPRVRERAMGDGKNNAGFG